MRSSVDDALERADALLFDRNAARRFLDFYGDQGLAEAFERYGLFGALRARGWTDTRFTTHAHDDRHTLFVEGLPTGADAERDEWVRLLELVVRRDRLVLDEQLGFDVLTVDWLLLQDPLRDFDEARPRLPGQQHPGLGIGERVLEMLYRVVDRLALDALVTTPEYLHNAILYARELRFADPTFDAQRAALEELLMEQEGLSLAQASWAVEWGTVLDAEDRSVEWKGEAMVRAMNDELKAKIVDDPARDEDVRRARESFRYRLHRARFDERWEAERASLTGG